MLIFLASSGLMKKVPKTCFMKNKNYIEVVTSHRQPVGC